MTETNSKAPHSKRAKILWLITLLFLMIGLGVFLYWWIWARFHEYTNDAYVSGNLVYVTPQINASITSIYVDDTNLVDMNHLLIELDPTDFRIALEESKAVCAKTVRNVAELFRQTKQAQALTEVSKINFIESAQDFERRVLLIDSGSVSKEDFDHAQNALTSAYFSLASSEQSYFSLKTQTEGTTVKTHPRVKEAIQNLKQATVNLSRCILKAPVGGLIAQKNAQVGTRVGAEEPLLAIIPLEQMWIDANFKEIQIGKMQIGQKVKIKTDVYGKKVIYQGSITGIGGGTGSVFSLLPPQNATGNWIKIVQRVPVRIALDPEEIKKHPLRLGLSVEATVDIHNIQSSCIPSIAPNTPLYQTTVFQGEEFGVDAIIEKIFKENLQEDEDL